jgi:multidrug efflux pump subunit AcrA (membrane-fusion protein)
MPHAFVNRSTLLRGTVLLALTLLVPAGCRRKEAAQDPSAKETRVVVTIAPVRVQNVQRTVEVIGTLFGEEESTISAKVPGRVVEVLRDVGDRIAPGEPLARVDATDYQLSVEQREAALSATLAELGLDALPTGEFQPERVPTVVRAKVELDNAEAKHRRAKAMFDERPPLISEQDYSDQLTAFEVARSSHQVALLTARALLAQAKTRSS